MASFTTTIQKFDQQGEKTGWSYITIPAAIAQAIKPNNKKSFRVKGKLDNYAFAGVALLPMCEGDFIMALNATMRKAIKKQKGDQLKVVLAEDKVGYELNADFMACLQDEPAAKAYFELLPRGHQNYFSKWIESAKTEVTASKRMAQAITALSRHMGFAEMVRSLKAEKDQLKG
jgi:hypothetical protein